MKPMIPMMAAALLAAACTPKSTPPPPPGPIAGLGKLGEVNGLRFQPIDVIEDSRCPVRVQCVWAGRVVVRTRIGAPGGGEELQLDLTLGQPAKVYGGTLTLVGVEPAKGTIGSLERDAYRFAFTYSR